MSESESEDEILDRIETALRKIASLPVGARSSDQPDDGHTKGRHGTGPKEGEPLDRAALAKKLDDIIGRLRAGLENVPPRTESGE